jgi:hypothetical protein
LEAKTVTTIESTMASLKDITFPSLYICNVNQVIDLLLINSQLIFVFVAGNSGNQAFPEMPVIPAIALAILGIIFFYIFQILGKNTTPRNQL